MLFFGFIPLFLLTGSGKADVVESNLDNGTYHFSISGTLNSEIDGRATFQNRIEVDGFGEKVHKLFLNFGSDESKVIHTIEFIIASRKGLQRGVSKGVYKIKNLDRLINKFNGVYGIADLGGFSELPFFIKTGEINILESYSDEVDGSLEVQFINANGETLNIEGFFNADLKV